MAVDRIGDVSSGKDTPGMAVLGVPGSTSRYLPECIGSLPSNSSVDGAWPMATKAPSTSRVEAFAGDGVFQIEVAKRSVFACLKALNRLVPKNLDLVGLKHTLLKDLLCTKFVAAVG